MSLATAILNEVANQQPDFQPLPRQFNAVIDAADSIVREFSRGEILSSPGAGICAWRRTDQVGLSADFLAAKLGDAGIRDYAHPQDPSDFGRCLTLLEAAPELREKLPEMANESPAWAALVANWDELEALWKEESPSGRCPKMFQRMEALLRQTAVMTTLPPDREPGSIDSQQKRYH
jgi:hypothetical protein